MGSQEENNSPNTEPKVTEHCNLERFRRAVMKKHNKLQENSEVF